MYIEDRLQVCATCEEKNSKNRVICEDCTKFRNRKNHWRPAKALRVYLELLEMEDPDAATPESPEVNCLNGGILPHD